jgi:TonB family protein
LSRQRVLVFEMANGSPLQAIQGIPASAVPHESTPGSVSLVVLTRDEALLHTLRLIGPEYAIAAVSAESDFASHLLTHTTGVAILDASAIASSIERLSERLRAQFPDLVLIVAGSVDDQSALATQITNGTIYRFLHKPVSEQRVKLFVDAAWRRHSEELAGGTAVPGTTAPARTRPGFASNLLVLGSVALTAAALIGAWSALHKSNSAGPATAAAEPAPTPVPVPTAPRDEVLEDRLARAAQALANGTLVSPPGANAADLYAQALRRDPKDSRAINGLDKVIDRLLSLAEAQLLAQHLDEAQKLTDQARAIKPDHVRVAFLMAQIGKERERAVLAQARQAASSGKIEQALSVLDSAARTGQHSTLVTQARQELEQKQLDERVREYVNRANERMRDGQLVEPAEDNAQFYVESARALAPNDTEVKQVQRLFLERLVSEARKALTTGNADQAQQAIQVAADAGAGQDEIDALNHEAERVRATAKADALAHLALLVNQRLLDGKVVEPQGDSAKSYLAQLQQADPNHPTTQVARQAFATRTLDEAKNAVHREDYAGAQRWLAEARGAGVDTASINTVNNDIKNAQDAADAASKANEVVAASSLEMTHYVPPEFPLAARERRMSGWVDVQFLVLMDGSVSNVAVVGADPAGVFETPATEAVRKWKYQPIMRDGKPINQRARVRVRFALQK